MKSFMTHWRAAKAAMQRHAFALCAIGMVVVSLYAALRDLVQLPVARRQLIGTWESAGLINAGREWPVPDPDAPGLRFTLHADGRASFGDDGPRATWHLGDARHLHIVHEFAPDPGTPGMEGGGSEDALYEIISFSPNRLVVRTFDIESDIIWQRVAETEQTE